MERMGVEHGKHHHEHMIGHMVKAASADHAPSQDHHAMMEADFKRRFIASPTLLSADFTRSAIGHRWKCARAHTRGV
jgi:hypothetical protein